ncbi:MULTISPECIES: nucleoside hydrolase [unclassified Corynebacterium]|uniref:uridine-preferring nucleoside hydrolase UriH n=1 Tax=unclassified Corynebacterium TaxID=2624378 RepID=UPI0029CA661B|nr:MULTISPECIES: nucleoside hydrolase [unclassified Corynebacterium]WPF65574.1 nucleoside hydrolase [Corynebacterium sp. 22KM0430]WPF68069.1 nucleoside hydrolase [Corynebacterium sp. 21KM1197]
MARKIILDCDPGHDDAVAILLAAGSPEIDLLGITTVGGNQTLSKVTYNARQVMTIAGLIDVPLHAGCARPLVRRAEAAADVHGESGMELHGFELPEPAVAVEPGHAVDYIIDTIMAHKPGEITLVPTGPLTNIAMAVRKEPRIAERVREVVLMGGGYHEGNKTATAEFNIATDPEAAHIVFNEAWPLVMVGLDLTHQALATREVEERFAALGTRAGDFVVGLCGFFREAYREAQGFDDPPVHDPCTIAYLIDPDVVSTVPVPLDVELRGELTAGMTVADFRAPAPPDCTTSVAVKLDHQGFWDLVVGAVERLH